VNLEHVLRQIQTNHGNLRHGRLLCLVESHIHQSGTMMPSGAVHPIIPGGAEHEAWLQEDTKVVDFFAPPREDFLLGGKPAYISEGEASGNAGPM